MNRLRHALALAAVLLPGLLFVAVPACAQEPGTVIISLYRIAPGKHMDFLRWQAARDAVAREAGVGATQWYVHLNGDSWDFVGITPDTTEEQDKQIDTLQTRKGLTTGFKASLEFRTLIASHTDTYARGPTTADALIASAGK